MTVLEMARKYYPRLWSRERVQAGRLSQDEAREVLGEKA